VILPANCHQKKEPTSHPLKRHCLGGFPVLKSDNPKGFGILAFETEKLPPLDPPLDYPIATPTVENINADSHHCLGVLKISTALVAVPV
jgi:hypothetical protein